jgi:DivIVA domain-containing protein
MTESRLAPEEVRTRTFTRVVRGYRRREVRRLLERAATDLARLRNGPPATGPDDPPPLTPEEIEEVRFQPSLGGYEMDEVDEFLDQLVVELERAAREPFRPQPLPAPLRPGPSSACSPGPPPPDPGAALQPGPRAPQPRSAGSRAAEPLPPAAATTAARSPDPGPATSSVPPAPPPAGPRIAEPRSPGAGSRAGEPGSPATGPGATEPLSRSPAAGSGLPAAGSRAAEPRLGAAGPLPVAPPPRSPAAPPPPTGTPAGREPGPAAPDEGFFPPESVPPSSAPAPPPPPPPATQRPQAQTAARPLTPSEVETRSFDRGAPGYLPAHVDLFLAKAARALAGRDGETLTRWDVLRQRFPLGPRGYAASEVDAFLVRLAAQFPEPDPAAQQEILRKLEGG